MNRINVSDDKLIQSRCSSIIQSPWPLFVIDNFLPQSILDLTTRELREIKQLGSLQSLEDHPFKTQYAVSNELALYKHFLAESFITEMESEFLCKFEFSKDQAIQYRTQTSKSEKFFSIMILVIAIRLGSYFI